MLETTDQRIADVDSVRSLTGNTFPDNSTLSQPPSRLNSVTTSAGDNSCNAGLEESALFSKGFQNALDITCMGYIAASAARHQDFDARLVILFQHQTRCKRAAAVPAAHKPAAPPPTTMRSQSKSAPARSFHLSSEVKQPTEVHVDIKHAEKLRASLSRSSPPARQGCRRSGRSHRAVANRHVGERSLPSRRRPGLAKTLMIRSLAETMHLSFHRIQFTPDLMPADITGTDIIQESKETGHREMVFERGPIFSQIVLADEINRTPPKTQAALLEAMQEHEVTVGGKTYKLAEPFLCLPLKIQSNRKAPIRCPKLKHDRFLFQVAVDYPSRDQEADIIDRTTSDLSTQLEAVVSGEEIIEFQAVVRRVPLPDHVKQLVLDLVRSLRPTQESPFGWVKQWLDWGPGPRACQQLVLAAKARSLLEGRYHATVDDIQALALPVLRHRIVPSFAAESESSRPDDLIRKALEATLRQRTTKDRGEN